MGRRSRKERPGGAAPAPGADPRVPGGADAMRRGYARAEERNAAVRAGLEPIAPAERPAALTVAVALATALAVGNLAAYVAGVEVDGRRPGVGGVLFFALLMLSAAWGMWRRHYWAVLGFEALLGITIGIAGLSLLVASNVSALVLCGVILVGGGVLFWKLIRVMARIQASHRGSG